MTEYIVRFHGEYRKGAKQSWWSETMADAADLETTLCEIENSDWEMEAVLHVGFQDGKWFGNDVTAMVREQLYERETAKLVEQFERGETSFYYLIGHLEMADRKFPDPNKANAPRELIGAE